MVVAPQKSRLVVGLMSGTSLDGIDAVIVQLTGSGRCMDIRQKVFVSRPYPERLRSLLLEAATADVFSVVALSQLNVRLAHAYADVVWEAVHEAGVPVEALDLIGSHGQTVRHVPVPEDCADLPTTSTLQIGDPSVLANLLGVPVVGDFRVADMALGGQGAPLVPYFDFICFADERETRGLLNLGGIANLTVLPAGESANAVRAFDTGPGNMIIDALAQRFFDVPFDQGGRLASAGCVSQRLLEQACRDPYFAASPPKSTGRERYGASFVERFIGWDCGLAPVDMLATATMLTAVSVHEAYTHFVAKVHPLDVLILSGGGQHNQYLVRQLSEMFSRVPVRLASEYGVNADAKEALCFAVLAHETLNGVPVGLPSVTGASRPARLGKICLP